VKQDAGEEGFTLLELIISLGLFALIAVTPTLIVAPSACRCRSTTSSQWLEGSSP